MAKRRGVCSGCGAPIDWVTLKSGKSCPLEIDITVSDGKQLLYVDELHGFKKLEAGRKGFLSHHAVCPDADKFRRKR